MGLFSSAIAMVVCAATVPCVSAQVPLPRSDSLAGFPDTPVGKLGHALIEVINEGDSAARTAPGASPLYQKLIEFLAWQ